MIFIQLWLPNIKNVQTKKEKKYKGHNRRVPSLARTITCEGIHLCDSNNLEHNNPSIYELLHRQLQYDMSIPHITMKYTNKNNGNDSESKLCDKTSNQMLLHEEE